MIAGDLKRNCRKPIQKSGVIGIKPYAWITIALLLVSSLILVFHFSTTNEEFSRYNVGWTGTSDFFSTLDRHTTVDIASPSDLAGYKNATLLLIAPDHTFTTAEGALYRDFVARGNTLLLADDFGSGNTLLRSFGSSILIRQGNLSSADRAYADVGMVVVHPVGDTWFFPAGSSLVVNQAATLTGGEPLLKTTIFSWVDENPDRNLSSVKVFGTLTVMAQEKIGNGTLYVLSDPSIFINGMNDHGAKYANRLFLDEIAHTPAPILIDTYGSRVMRVDGLGEIIQLVRSNTAYTFVFAALLMAGVVIAWYRRVI
jgi:hypothetical protein